MTQQDVLNRLREKLAKYKAELNSKGLYLMERCIRSLERDVA